MVKTKIICTIGPASDSVTVLRKMMLAGMDVARLNFSHGTHAQHLERIKKIRLLNQRYRRRIAILQDLEGYRIRIGSLKPSKQVVLKKRQKIILSNKESCAAHVIPFDYSGDLSAIKAGSHVYIDDGTIDLRVKSSHKHELIGEVVVPGVIKEHKGVNIPDAALSFSGITEKDKFDLDFGVEHKVDAIAQSFVRSKRDILQLRQYLSGRLPSCKIIAKIENREGINNIKEIIAVSDGIMIARGDMGVSIPIYEVPFVQKQIIRACNRAKKLVITATQMLESMTEQIRPTRAEVTDVANAIIDGTDCVMLSAETAAGLYPVEAVTMMNKIIIFTEKTIQEKD
ncbi:MAG: pyruvate kinase [Candidatus Omnitrophica bacterium]|nr:pyruvate kinase [Candidatus Omnitrophota bacterium]